MIRIGVSGPGASGKTTLVTDLSLRMDLPMVSEGVWEWIAAERIEEPWNLSADDQLRLHRHVIAHKVAQERRLPAFVSDRTTVDAVTLMTLRLTVLGQPVPADLRDAALAHAAKTYDVAILLTRQLAAAKPGSDHAEPGFRMSESQLTRALYESISVPILDIPAMSASEVGSFVAFSLRSVTSR